MSRSHNPNSVPTGGETRSRTRTVLYSIGALASGVTAGIFVNEAAQDYYNWEIGSGLAYSGLALAAGYAGITCLYNMTHPKPHIPPQHHP